MTLNKSDVEALAQVHWSLIENEDGTKTIVHDDRVVGIYGHTSGRWTGIKLDGSMFWDTSEVGIYNQLIGVA